MLASPPGSVAGRLRMTEQGKVSHLLSTRWRADRHPQILEQTAGGGWIQASLDTTGSVAERDFTAAGISGWRG